MTGLHMLLIINHTPVLCLDTAVNTLRERVHSLTAILHQQICNRKSAD